MSVGEPLRLDASPVPQNHLVGRNGDVWAFLQRLDEKFAGVRCDWSFLFSTKINDGVDTL